MKGAIEKMLDLLTDYDMYVALNTLIKVQNKCDSVTEAHTWGTVVHAVPEAAPIH